MSQTVQFNPSYEEVTLSYTGTTADISVGDLVRDRRQRHGWSSRRRSSGHGTPDEVEISGVVDPGQRERHRDRLYPPWWSYQGIVLKTAAGNFTMNCAANSPNTYVGVADGSFLATTISDSSNDTIVEQARYIGFQMTDLSGGAGSGTVHVGGF